VITDDVHLGHVSVNVRATTGSDLRSPAEGPPRRRRKWGRWLVTLLILALVTHPWWLQACGRLLVVEEPFERADVVIVQDGDHRFQRAAELFGSGRVSSIWVVRRNESYAEAARIVPAAYAIGCELLRAAGAAGEQIVVLPGSAREVEDAARIVRASLERSPGTDAVLLCDRFRSRNVRKIYEQILEDDLSQRVRVMGLARDDCDETNWWKSRTGWKEVLFGGLELGFTVLVGVEGPPTERSFDPDEFERQFLSDFGSIVCPRVSGDE
jgi:hypothetical protein